MYMGMRLNALADNIAVDPERLIAVPERVEEKPSLRLHGVIIEDPVPPKRKRLSELLP
uniref:Uncharacterized protein n=1 Tax=Arsenophonus endosymbiont of Trialeurodes vaporariorum TaxID=235567 RepID=A0A3B0M2H4_9GAMM